MIRSCVARLGPLLALCACAPALAAGDLLYVVHDLANSVAIDVIDARSDSPMSMIPLAKRVVTARKAMEFESASPPWVSDSKERRGESVSLGIWPEAIAASREIVFGAVGDEEVGYVFEVHGAAAAPTYFDTLQRHAFAIVAAADRVFVSYVNRGVWSIDPRSGAAHRVDDRRDPSVQLARLTSGKEQPDGEWRAELSDGKGSGGLLSECTWMASSTDGGKLFVAGSYQGAATVLVLDAKKEKLIRALRLAAASAKSEAIVGLGAMDDRHMYLATTDSTRELLHLYTLDAASGRMAVAASPVFRVRPSATTGKRSAIAVAGGFLFVLSGSTIKAFPLSTRGSEQTIPVSKVPAGILATADGRKVYVSVPEEHRILSLSVVDGMVVGGNPIVIQGDLGAMAIGPER